MKFGFFGCGNMGRAIAEGIRKNDSQAQLYFYTPTQTKAEILAGELKGQHVKVLSEMPKDLDWYVLAFKPQSLNDFQFTFFKEQKVLSILAGTSLETLKKKCQTNDVSRLMPNTPSGLGAGANLLFAPEHALELEKILTPLGKVFTVSSEDELDLLTPFTGSGPALVFEFARIFEEALNEMSPHPAAREMIAQTFLGSSKLMMEASRTNTSFEVLREQVTSKKGVTFEALKIMEKEQLPDIMKKAFKAAHARTLELKKGL